MKKGTILIMLLVFGIMAGLAGSTLAQPRKHVTSGWIQKMAGYLGDTQNIISALATFDMKRLADTADQLAAKAETDAKRPRKTTTLNEAFDKLIAPTRALAAAARAGDDTLAAEKIGDILKACSSCHYNVRDKKRREKAMQKK